MGRHDQRLVLSGILCLLQVIFAAAPAFAQRGPSLVEVMKVTERDVASTQATLGTITPTRRAVIGSAVDGRVVDLLVRAGDRVEKDQELARLLDSTISLEVEAAKAELILREAELEELENGSLPQELAQAKARLEATRVIVEYSEKNKKRFVELEDTSAISVSEYENAVSTWLESHQRYEEAKAAYQLAVDGPRSEKIKQANARVAVQKAIVERLEDQKIKHTMFSKFAGYVTVEHTEVGQWLPRGEPVAEIIAIDEVDVLARVPEAHVPFVHLGDTVMVEVPALPGRSFPGTVVAVIPEADERSRTFPVKVRVANEMNAAGEMLLKAGMLARATLVTGAKLPRTMVPKDALVLNGNTTMIWVIDEASITAGQGKMLEANAIGMPVTTGVEDENWIEIIGDLRADTPVVVRGNERIPAARPGAPPSRVTWAATP